VLHLRGRDSDCVVVQTLFIPMEIGDELDRGDDSGEA
jgi:hypothetical protein